MAEVNHDLLEVIQMAIKLSKLEQHPVGSLWVTMSDDDPAVVFGGGYGSALRHTASSAAMMTMRPVQ